MADLEINGARGEVPLRVGGVDLVIAAEMKRLSAVSTQLGCKSLAELFLRLTGVEVAATEAGIIHLTVRGEALDALANLSLRDFNACGVAFAAALAHHFEGEAGNVAGAKGLASQKPAAPN